MIRRFWAWYLRFVGVKASRPIGKFTPILEKI